MNNSNEKKLNKSKILKLIIILILIISISMLIILYNRNSSVHFFIDKYVFQKYVSEDTLAYISVDPSSNCYYYVYDNKLIVLCQNVLTVYNKSGNNLYTLDIQINKPIFASNGKYLCIAENGGTKAYVISEKNIVWQKDLDGTINNININQNGFVAITIQSGSYQSIILAFNLSGTELFKTYLAQDYVICTTISNDNKYLAIAHANFSGTIIESKIKIISIENASLSSENAVYSEQTAASDDLIINISFTKTGTLMCMFDSYIGILENNTIKKLYEFNADHIIFGSLNNTIVTIVKNSNGLLTSSFDIKILNPDNNVCKTYNITEEPREIYTYNDTIALNFGADALFLNNNGVLLKKYTSSQEIQDILICDNLACIVYKNKIEFLSL